MGSNKRPWSVELGIELPIVAGKRRETMWCEVMVELKRALKCDSTAGREWDHVGRRKAKEPGRKENAG